MDRQHLELLVKIGRLIAQVKQQQELLKLIIDELQPPFKFEDVGLFVLDKQENYHEDWTTLMPGMSPSEGNYFNHQRKINKMPHKGSLIDWMMKCLEKEDRAILFDHEELAKKFPQYPQSETTRQFGYRDCLATVLKVQGETLGMFCINSLEKDFFKENQFPLFQAIADQLAVAVSNVLANEQLREEKQKTEQLLEVTETIANINTGPGLIRAIFDQLQKVFPFDEAGLFHIDWEKKVERDLVVDYNYETSKATSFIRSKGLIGELPLQELTKFITESGVLVIPAEELYRRFDHPHFVFTKKIQFKQIITGPLKWGEQTIGVLYFWSKDAQAFDHSISLFQSVTDQLSVALANVMANKKLHEEKQKTEDLLSVTKSIANINSAPALVTAIFDRLRVTFPFDDAGLFYLDFEKELERDLMVDFQYATTGLNVDLHKPGYHGWQPMSSSSKSLAKVETRIMSVEELIRRYDHHHWEVVRGPGLKQVIVGPLKHSDQVIGLLYFWSNDPGRFSQYDLAFFESIAQQLTVALSNVMANEQLIEEKRKTEQLLEVTEAIANINSGPELVHAIFNRLKQVFPFDDAGLFHLDWENQRERDLVVDYNYDGSAACSALRDAGLTGWLPLNESATHITTHGPLIMDVQELYERYEHPHMEYLKQVSFQQIMAGPLLKGDETIGVLYLWTKTHGSFDPQLPIFKSICDQLTVALSNVIANEKLTEEKQFKETLLGISEATASIQDRKELFKVIIHRIQPLIPFDDIGVFHMDPSGTFHRDLAVTDALVTTNAQYTQDLHDKELGGYLPHDESVEIFMREGPIVLSFEELVEKFPGHPFFPVMEKAGIQETLGGPLVYQERKIGMLACNSLEKGRYDESFFPLFRAIAEQLAIAVNNVVANEQLIEEKQFKETLLGIAEAIANINTGEELIKAIFDKLVKVFPFNDAGLFILDFENERERDLMVDYALNYTGANPQLKEDGLGGWLPLSKPSRKLAKQGISIMSSVEFINGFDHPHLERIEEFDLEELIAGPLKNGEEVIGILYFWSKRKGRFGERDKALFKSIANQLSVTLSNVLANEALLRSEQEEALKVQLINALNTPGEWDNKLIQVAKTLQHYFPFHMLTFNVPGAGPSAPNYVIERIGKDEYRLIGMDTFCSLTGLKPKEVQDQVQKDIKGPPCIMTEGDILQSKSKNKLKWIFYERFHIRDIIVFPMSLRGGMMIKLGFYHKEERKYKEDHLALLGRIASSFSLALDRQINYFETLRLNELIAQENKYLQEEIQLNYNFGEIVGSSTVMEDVFLKVLQVANTPTNVLLTGETGTGKELIARALHNQGDRKEHKFIKLNCATLPSELIESELFGHEKGAFTGALQRRIGKFELADKGTIFLDEIGEMPLELQAKLLRVIQEREFERLGGNTVIKTDARIVAATNRDLPSEVAADRFRSDLYYRLNVFPIHLPPLRERTEDIPEMVQHFISKYNGRLKKRVKDLGKRSLRSFINYTWPGNVRELEHVIERAMITATGTTLEIELEMPKTMLTNPSAEGADALSPLKTYEQGEIELIMNTLRFTDGKISGPGGAAEILQLKPTTLESKMKRFGITRKHMVGDKNAKTS